MQKARRGNLELRTFDNSAPLSHRMNELLVLRAQAGDREALEELLRAVQPKLQRYLRAVIGDDAASDDVLQEVLFLIYRKLDWLREPKVFEAWAYRIASREAFRRLRKQRALSEVAIEEDFTDFAPPDHELLDALPKHLDELSPASRAVVTLHYLQSMTLQEVADILGIALGTAKSRLAYGLRRLRRALEVI